MVYLVSHIYNTFEDILSALHWTNTANNTKYARTIGMHCNGTIKTNRKGINQELLSAISTKEKARTRNDGTQQS